MNNKCEKCGEHHLECWCRKYFPKGNDHFFYQGKFFEKEEEFFTYMKEFNSRQTQVEDFDRLFDMLKKDIWMNLSMRKKELSNDKLQKILEESFYFILKKMDNNNQE